MIRLVLHPWLNLWATVVEACCQFQFPGAERTIAVLEPVRMEDNCTLVFLGTGVSLHMYADCVMDSFKFLPGRHVDRVPCSDARQGCIFFNGLSSNKTSLEPADHGFFSSSYLPTTTSSTHFNPRT
jgi:hypothetical protein